MEKKAHFSGRIPSANLDRRWTPMTFHPEYQRYIDRLFNSSLKLKRLNSKDVVVAWGDGDHGSPKFFKKGIPFIQGQHLKNIIADFPGNNAVFITQEKHNQLSSSKLKPGDLLVVKKGTIGDISIFPQSLKEANTGAEVCFFRFKPEIDAYYIAAYLASAYGQPSLLRLSHKSTRPTLGLNELDEIFFPYIEHEIQNYIGDKVRLAEKLRERSKELEQEAKNLFENELLWEQQLETRKIHGRVEVKDLEQRLDINFNSPNRLSLLQHLRKNNINTEALANLVEISAMIGWKGLTTEHYTDKGPWLLRGVEFSNGIIYFDSLVSIKKHKYDEQPQIHLKEGDIAFTKDGTIGKAIVIPSLSNDLAAGSTVARLRFYSDEKINRYYLEYVLNHPVMQIQIMSFATGMAQPHITQEWIAKLQIPRCQSEEKIGHKIKFHHECLIESENLTTAAKFLVEALIEGKLTKIELKEAQTALQKGDIEPDKVILAKLTRQGYDIPDQPALFPDLDALYEAIKEINLISNS